jgi:hypothetical protein
MLRGSKLAVTLVHPYILAPHLPFSPYLLPYVWKIKEGQKRREQKRKRNRRKYQDLEGACLASSLSHGRAGLDPFFQYTKPPASMGLLK